MCSSLATGRNIAIRSVVKRQQLLRQPRYLAACWSSPAKSSLYHKHRSNNDLCRYDTNRTTRACAVHSTPRVRAMGAILVIGCGLDIF